MIAPTIYEAFDEILFRPMSLGPVEQLLAVRSIENDLLRRFFGLRFLVLGVKSRGENPHCKWRRQNVPDGGVIVYQSG